METTEITSLIREQVPMEALFEKLEIPLSAGSKALCLFHSEKSPSMKVYENGFYCFGCQESGDAITIVREVEGLSFFEAISYLNETFKLGMDTSLELDEETKKNIHLKSVLLRMAEHCNEVLLQTEGLDAERQFVRERDIHGPDVKKWLIGYCNSYQIHKDIGCTEQDLLDAGVYGKSKEGKVHNMFYRRILFPIFDINNKVVSFGGRTLDPEEKSKYVNTPETTLYDKSKTLYGLNNAKTAIRKAREVIVVEGYTDVIKQHQQGCHNVVASCGTAFTVSNFNALRKLADKIVLMYDGDKAGRNSMYKTITEQRESIQHVLVAPLPEGEDPGSLTPEKLSHVVRVDPVTWGIDYLNQGVDGMEETEKQQAYDDSVEFLKSMVGATVLYSSGQRHLSNIHDLALNIVKRDSQARRVAAPSLAPTTEREQKPNPSMTVSSLWNSRETYAIPDQWFVSMGYDPSQFSDIIGEADHDKMMSLVVRLTASALLKHGSLDFEEIRDVSALLSSPAPTTSDTSYVLQLWDRDLKTAESAIVAPPAVVEEFTF